MLDHSNAFGFFPIPRWSFPIRKGALARVDQIGDSGSSTPFLSDRALPDLVVWATSEGEWSICLVVEESDSLLQENGKDARKVSAMLEDNFILKSSSIALKKIKNLKVEFVQGEIF
ncbi:hypothetical protein U1Q18_004911 [Sarracenia purpurea var. burkii]